MADPGLLALFVVATFLGALVAGLAGFAFGLIAAAIWLHILTPLQAATLIVCYGLIVQGYAVWKLRHALDWRRLLPMMIGGQLGIPLGVELLRWLPAADMRAAIGVVLVAFSLYSLLRPKLRPMTDAGRLARWHRRRRERHRRRRDRPCRHPADHLGEPARLDQGRAARGVPAGRRRDLCRLPVVAGRHRQLRPANPAALPRRTARPSCRNLGRSAALRPPRRSGLPQGRPRLAAPGRCCFGCPADPFDILIALPTRTTRG